MVRPADAYDASPHDILIQNFDNLLHQLLELLLTDLSVAVDVEFVDDVFDVVHAWLFTSHVAYQL